MNKISSYSKKLLYFLLTFIVVYFLFLLLFSMTGKSNPIAKTDTSKSSLSKFLEYKTAKNLDILFLGSSVILQGIDPRIFEQNDISVFNMGTKLQTPLNSYFLYKSLLKLNNTSVKLLVVDINMFVLSVESDESTFDLISNSPLSTENIALCFKSKNPMTFNTLFTSYITPPKTQTIKVDTNYNVINRGFLESNHNENSNKKLTRDKIEIRKEYWEYISKLAILAKQNNTKIIFITQPSPSIWKASVVNYEANRLAIDSFFTTQNLRYIDFNKKYMLDDQKDYLDHLHLNNSGVKKYNEILIRELTSILY
jgi:hypothetical protein